MTAREFLPLFDAVCNGTATVLLVSGWIAIRGGRRELHARLMIAATVASALFLTGYLTYHFGVGSETRLNASGWVKTAYLAMLATHVVLAAVQVPLILRTLWLAYRGRFEAHRRWARWTLPIWLYVSVTGVVVYLALYVFNPPVR